MNLVDSSGWLEYFSDGPSAVSFEKALLNVENLIVPTICLYEVFKVVLRERGEDEALQAIALMRQGKVVDLTHEIAMLAAKISLEYKMPMADSMILATAQMHKATIWTMDEDFKDLSGIKYFKKINPKLRS
jgi:predicted nucleic acid-binding protein